MGKPVSIDFEFMNFMAIFIFASLITFMYA